MFTGFMLIIFFNVSFFQSTQTNPLLAPPTPISQQEVNSMQQAWGADWRSDNVGIIFSCGHEKTNMYIMFTSELPEGVAQYRDYFVQENIGKGRLGYVYTYEQQRNTEIQQPIKPFTLQELEEDPEYQDYYLTTPRDFTHNVDKIVPQKITTQELTHFIAEKTVIFYTGAGISIAGGVHSMTSLEKALTLDFKNPCSFVHNAITNPEPIVAAFNDFCHCAFNNQPTLAHWALTKLACYKQCTILTENFDYLHRRTGYKPYQANAYQLKKSVDVSSLQKIDAVICIGLSHDDRGFLAWFKNHNPNGIIIAVDIAQPGYLGNEDWWCEGDLQQVLPTVLTNLTQLSENI